MTGNDLPAIIKQVDVNRRQSKKAIVWLQTETQQRIVEACGAKSSRRVPAVRALSDLHQHCVDAGFQLCLANGVIQNSGGIDILPRDFDTVHPGNDADIVRQAQNRWLISRAEDFGIGVCNNVVAA